MTLQEKESYIKGILTRNNLINKREIERMVGLRKYAVYEYLHGRPTMTNKDIEAVYSVLRNANKMAQ